MTSLHLLNDCAEINKMLNVPIQKLSTIHLAAPRSHTTERIIREDPCGLSGARTLSGEAVLATNILSIHVNQGSTHARRRDRTAGT